MNSKKKPTKYIKDKINQLVDTSVNLKNKMKEYETKEKAHKSLATGFDEGQSNFFQHGITICKEKLDEIRGALGKIISKYILGKKEQKKVEIIKDDEGAKKRNRKTS